MINALDIPIDYDAMGRRAAWMAAATQRPADPHRGPIYIDPDAVAFDHYQIDRKQTLLTPKRPRERKLR